MQRNEMEALKILLRNHGARGGLNELMDLSGEISEKYGISIKPTCDAKYLEVGISSKSDNVDTILKKICKETKIRPQECAYWGDEFVALEEKIYGSDSFMYTDKTKEGDFFDVSDLPGMRPEGVIQLGGGIPTFLEFLKKLETVLPL